MKTLLITLLFVVTCSVNAQLTISCNFREDGTWNEKTQKWDISSTDSNLSVFNFTKELKSFRHITTSISSMYTITDWDYDEDESLYEMNVKSDAGNEYELMIDGVNEYVIFFWYDSKKVYHMVRHTIKETWYDE